MLKFGTTVISLFVATFGGATADTLAAATTYPTSNPLSSPDLPAPQSSLPDFFDLNDLDDFVTQEYGDPITTPVHEDIHRLYYQNLDSLSSDQEEMDYVLQIMKRFQVDTASFADPSLNWKNKEVLSKYTPNKPSASLFLPRPIHQAATYRRMLTLITNQEAP
jgi:hypothetical protein